MEQDETNKRTHLYTYEELDGKSITMSAYHYQSLWQALRLIENRLPVEDGCVDCGSDLELGEVHNCLIAAAVCTGERLSNRNLAEAIQQRVMMPKAGNQDAYDQGNTLHKQSMASEKKSSKTKTSSPNDNPSKQVQVISRNLIDSLRVVLSMLGYGPLSTSQTPPSPEDIARCATLHLLEALKHLHYNEIGLARTSFEQSAQLLNVFDEAVQ